MNEFIVKEEAFRLNLFDKVPEPTSGECFLLYQQGAGINNSMVVSNGVKYSNTAVRHGHYNMKVTLSLREKSFVKHYQVAMKDRDFYFDVSVEISYLLQDVQEYFFHGQMEGDDIQRVVREAVRAQDGKWDVREGIDMERDLDSLIEQKLKRFAGVRIRPPKVSAVPDEAAVKILNSNRDRTVEMFRSRNEADKEIETNRQGGRIADSKKLLKEKQIEDLANMVQNFGNMAPIMEEYFKGNLNGTQLYEYIARVKSENMTILNEAVKNDMLPDKDIIDKINGILGDNVIIQGNRQHRLVSSKEPVAEIGVKESEEGAVEGEEDLETSFADGDLL